MIPKKLRSVPNTQYYWILFS